MLKYKCICDTPEKLHPQCKAEKHDCATANEGCARAAGYAWGDPCPECKQPLDYDGGQRATREEPEQAPCCYCPDCGLEFPVRHTAERSGGTSAAVTGSA